jgi:hypothetical protein
VSRPHPLVTGAALLAVIAVGLGAYLAVHHRRRPSVVEAEDAPPPPRPAAAAPVLARPPQLPPRPAAPPSVSEALQRRDLLVAAHAQQAIQEADEQAFAHLGMPEEQRVAIRRLNERQSRRRQSLLSDGRHDRAVEEQAGDAVAIGEEADRARGAALRELLGNEAAQSFLQSERAEIRRLQRRYRQQWAEELEQQAPLPPGLPPRAH